MYAKWNEINEDERTKLCLKLDLMRSWKNCLLNNVVVVDNVKKMSRFVDAQFNVIEHLSELEIFATQNSLN